MAPWQWWSDSAGPGSRKGTGECGIVLGGRTGVDYVRSDMRAQLQRYGVGTWAANFGSHGSDDAMTTLFLPLRIRLPRLSPRLPFAWLCSTVSSWLYRLAQPSFHPRIYLSCPGCERRVMLGASSSPTADGDAHIRCISSVHGAIPCGRQTVHDISPFLCHACVVSQTVRLRCSPCLTSITYSLSASIERSPRQFDLLFPKYGKSHQTYTAIFSLG
jgi:hypothetical protein